MTELTAKSIIEYYIHTKDKVGAEQSIDQLITNKCEEQVDIAIKTIFGNKTKRQQDAIKIKIPFPIGVE